MFPDTVSNGDFEIATTAISPPLLGDGIDEGTLWTFDYTTAPFFLVFPTSGAVISACLTLTLTPKHVDVSTDQLGIRRLGIKNATPEMRALPVDQTATVQVQLVDPDFYTGAAILDALVRSHGTLAMLYTDDAIVSFARLDLVALLDADDPLEQAARAIAVDINGLALGLFTGPNANANLGQRNALANRATDAANAIAAGNIQGAIEALTSLLEKIDGQSPPPDWLVDSPEKTALTQEVSVLISLLMRL